MRKKIELKGIVRNTPDNTSIDGTCQEAINVRYEDNRIKPISDKVTLPLFSVANNRLHYIHHVDTNTILVEYDISTGLIHYKLEGKSEIQIPIDIGSGRNALQILGVSAILVLFDENSIEYLTWDFSNNLYVYTDNSVMELPKIDIKPYFAPLDVEWLPFRYVDGPPALNYLTTYLGNVNAQYTKNYLKGLISGFVSVMYTLELYDGSIYLFSSPKMIYIGNLCKNVLPIPDLFPDGDDRTYTRVSPLGIIKYYTYTNYGNRNPNLSIYQTDPTFNFMGDLDKAPTLFVKFNWLNQGGLNYSISQSEVDKILSYKSIIKNVSFYMTCPNTLYNTTQFMNDFSDFLKGKLSSIDVGSDKKVKDIMTNGIYYNILTVSIDELTAQTNKVIDLGDATPDKFITRDSLKTASYSYNKNGARLGMVYNKRLFLGDITTKIESDVNLSDIVLGTPSGSTYNYFMDIILTINNSQRVIRSETNTTDDFSVLSIPTTVTYPDLRATKINIVASQDNVNFYILKTIKLDPSSTLNYAYALTDGILYAKQYWYVLESRFLIPFVLNTFPKVNYNLNNVISDTNKVIASNIDDPFVFDAANTYQVGTNKIIALASYAATISTGQYGKFPIIVFTESGTWSMDLGISSLIESIRKLNNDVCNNPNSLCHVLGTSMVYSSKEGMHIISTHQSDLLSLPVHGTLKNQIFESIDYYDPSKFAGFPNGDEFYSFLPEISHLDFNFLDYITDCICGYDSHRHELIISNNNYPFSFIYCFKSKEWVKSLQVFDKFINDYPKLYGVIGDNFLDCNSELADSNTDSTLTKEIFIQSRPIKFTLDVLKKIERIILNGNLNIKLGTHFGFYIFGSKDGLTYFFYDGVNQIGEFSKLYLNKQASAQEYVIVITGNVGMLSYITHMDIEFTETLQNKLR